MSPFLFFDAFVFKADHFLEQPLVCFRALFAPFKASLLEIGLPNVAVFTLNSNDFTQRFAKQCAFVVVDKSMYVFEGFRAAAAPLSRDDLLLR